MKIWIFGDSFAASNKHGSWVRSLGITHEVINHATNGASEHRIWKTYRTHAIKIKPEDRVIFCHTSPSRVYLKDSKSSLSRMLRSHPVCDLIFSDVFAKAEQQFMNILQTIWDDEYFDDTFNLIVRDLQSVPNSIHITFFDSNIKNYYDVWMEHPGNINHLSAQGNVIVYTDIVNNLI